jgi:predicted RNase H-like nuclease (RuvC/YqgF family)
LQELDNAGVSVGLLRKGLMAARDELRAEKRQVTVYERANDGLMRTSTTVVDSLRAENKELKEAISEFQRMPMRLSELQRENRQLQVGALHNSHVMTMSWKGIVMHG